VPYVTAEFCEWPVVTVSPEMNIAEACQMMWETNVGCVVAAEAGKLCGILTDRDAALRVIRERKDPQRTTVREIMTSNPACIRVDKMLHELTPLMRQPHVRRVPIVDDRDKPIGIVTFDDLLVLLSEEMSDMGQIVSETFSRKLSDEQPSFSYPSDYWWSAYLPLPPQRAERSERRQNGLEAFYRKLADEQSYNWSLLCDSL
jgi:predicted transcriptional regulator